MTISEDIVATDREPIVRLAGVGKRFGERRVLEDLDLEIRPGEFVSVVGPSGTGKSTLLRIITGLDRDVDGAVTIPGKVAVGFQEPRLLPWQRVWRNVVLGLGADATKKRALDALREVGLEGHADAWPLTLSGGEAQRASLARALVREPQLLVLDEPFGALDALTRIKMHGLLLDLFTAHRPAVLLVTHDVEEAISLSDRVIVLRDGGIAVDARVDLPHPRARAGERFAALRTQLLAELGVHESV